jgi:hypothetical protein
LADTDFPSEKNFEVENFELLTMIFAVNILSVEMFLECKWALTCVAGRRQINGVSLRRFNLKFNSINEMTFPVKLESRFADFVIQHYQIFNKEYLVHFTFPI